MGLFSLASFFHIAFDKRTGTFDKKTGILNLNNTKLTSTDVEKLCHYLGEHPEIKKLSVRNCGLNIESVRRIAQVTTINWLDIDYNSLDDAGAFILAATTHLRVLSAANNDIHERGGLALAKNKYIRELDLNSNHLREASAKAFIENTTLTKLDISSNKIDSKLESVVMNFQNNSYLSPKYIALVNTRIAKNKSKQIQLDKIYRFGRLLGQWKRQKNKPGFESAGHDIVPKIFNKTVNPFFFGATQDEGEKKIDEIMLKYSAKPRKRDI